MRTRLNYLGKSLPGGNCLARSGAAMLRVGLVKLFLSIDVHRWEKAVECEKHQSNICN